MGSEKHSIAGRHNVREIPCRELTLELGKRTLIMGILNTTPDSFSDGGQAVSVESAVAKAQQLVEHGADIIDIGGESTRPGAQPVALEEELQRVIPVVEALIKLDLNVPISIDTYKAEVASRALACGAHIINDVWGLRHDPRMAEVVSSYQCPIIITHNRQQPKAYTQLVDEVITELQESIQLARAAGIKDEMIILDPGIGFAKTLTDNLRLMNQLHRIVELGYPVLLGTSRKSMIQKTLALPADQVIEGTAATVALGIAQGCQIMRVHDIEEMNKVARMTDAIVRRWQ